MLAALALFAWTGWRRGTIPTALSLLGLVGGYMGALILYRPIGAMLHRTWGVPPFLAAPLGGAIALFGVSLVLRIVAWKVNKALALRRLAGWHPSTPDRAGGAILAAMWALGIVIVAAWMLMAVRSFTRRGPDISRSVTGRLSAWATQRVTFAATRRMAGDPLVATIISRLAADPQRGAAALRSLATDMRVRTLLTDPRTRAAIAAGDAAALAASPAVRAIAADPGLTSAARQLGLIGEGAGADAVARDIATRAAPLARTSEALRTDPEMQRLLRDPGIQQKLAEGNIDALVTDPGFNRLMSRMLELLRRGAPPH